MNKTPIHVRFSDIDMAGNVHNSKYLSYFEQARIDFLTDIAGLDWNWRKQGLVLGRNEVDYLKPLYLRDKVIIKTNCDHIGTKSFTLSYELYKIEGEKETLCTKGRSIMICMDFESNETVDIFSSWKDQLMETI
mgnify:FL=1